MKNVTGGSAASSDKTSAPISAESRYTDRSSRILHPLPLDVVAVDEVLALGDLVDALAPWRAPLVKLYDASLAPGWQRTDGDALLTAMHDAGAIAAIRREIEKLPKWEGLDKRKRVGNAGNPPIRRLLHLVVDAIENGRAVEPANAEFWTAFKLAGDSLRRRPDVDQDHADELLVRQVIAEQRELAVREFDRRRRVGEGEQRLADIEREDREKLELIELARLSWKTAGECAQMHGGSVGMWKAALSRAAVHQPTEVRQTNRIGSNEPKREYSQMLVEQVLAKRRSAANRGRTAELETSSPRRGR